MVIVDEVEDIVFLYEIVWNVGDFDTDILRMTKGGFSVEVFDVKADRFRARVREGAIDLNIESFKQACIGANFTRVDDVVVPNGDVSAVLFFLVWFVFANSFGVCDLPLSIGWGILVADGMEGLYPFHSLL